MRYKKIVLATILSTSVFADEALEITTGEIPVTANPLSLSADEMVRPINIMNGVSLQNRKSSSLGSMLDSVPGVSNSSWGDSIGRPVIRGMDRNRIQILNNGMQVKDVSNVAGDHAIAMDSLSTEQIEVVRGPETIIYGGGAIGGVVNLIDYRIHPEFIDGIVGKYDASTGGANNATSTSLLMDFGANNVMFHIDLYDRDSKNIKIPGFSVSKKLADSDDEFTRSKYGKDTLQNSYNESQGGGVGATYFFNNGFTGFSYASHEQEYGNILENDAFVDLESDNFKYVLEMNNLSNLVNKFKFKLSHTDYQHKEMEGPTEIGLDYFDKGTDGKVEFTHSLLSESGGVVGLDFGASRFSQVTKPYEPNNKRHNFGFYALERFAMGNHKITMGLRHDYQEYDANAFTSDDGAPTDGGAEGSTSFVATEKDFNVTSFSVGTTSKINDNWSLGFSAAHTERAPNHNESQGGGVGATYFFNNGFTGFSYASHEQEYGNILENDAFVDLESDNFKYVLEMNNLSNLVNKFKFKLSHTDYQHKEMEGPTEIGLDYFDKGTDGKVEFTHSLLSESGGVVGLDFGASRFSQVTKPYEPNNKRHNFGFYALERFAMGNHKITMGLRHDYQEYDANAFTSDDGAPTDGGAEGSTSFVATEKDFNVTSFSVGTTSKINDNWSLGFSAAHTERAPNHDELFVFGEHHATETIEHGDRNLKAERSNSIDVTLNWANQGNTFSMTPYFNDFSSFIALLDTGVVQFHDHGGESEALPVLLHQNVPAEFYGFEFQGNINLGANYAFNYRGDYVRAKNKDGGNLPRIPPLTLGSGLSYEWNTLQASVDVEHKFSQSDTVAGEFKTDDFTNLSLVVNYALPYVAGLNAFIKGDNLLDEERRDHTSFLKEKVLLGERSFMIGISGSF